MEFSTKRSPWYFFPKKIWLKMIYMLWNGFCMVGDIHLGRGSFDQSPVDQRVLLTRVFLTRVPLTRGFLTRGFLTRGFIWPEGLFDQRFHWPEDFLTRVTFHQRYPMHYIWPEDKKMHFISLLYCVSWGTNLRVRSFWMVTIIHLPEGSTQPAVYMIQRNPVSRAGLGYVFF